LAASRLPTPFEAADATSKVPSGELLEALAAASSITAGTSDGFLSEVGGSDDDDRLVTSARFRLHLSSR